jgi:hypothetical protein
MTGLGGSSRSATAVSRVSEPPPADQAPQHPLRVPHDTAHVQDLGLEHLLAAERKQLLGQLGCLSGAIEARLDIGAGFFVQAFADKRQLVEADDGREQVVEVVSDTAGKPSDGLHLLGLPQKLFAAAERFLRLPLLGDVDPVPDHLHRLAGGALHRAENPCHVSCDAVVESLRLLDADRSVLFETSREGLVDLGSDLLGEPEEAPELRRRHAHAEAPLIRVVESGGIEEQDLLVGIEERHLDGQALQDAVQPVVGELQLTLRDRLAVHHAVDRSREAADVGRRGTSCSRGLIAPGDSLRRDREFVQWLQHPPDENQRKR